MIACAPSFQDPRKSRVTYKLRVKTSDRPGAGTDANVYIELRGEHGSTGEIQEEEEVSGGVLITRAPWGLHNVEHTRCQKRSLWALWA